MKQRLKKGIAFALVVLLLATCVPMRTFAEGNQVPQTQTVETEVETTSAQTDQTHTDQVPTETVQTPTADGAPTQGPEVKTGPVDGDASAAPAQNTPKTQTGETTLQTIQLDVAAVEVIDFGEGSAVVIKEPPQQVVTAAAENGKLTITAVEAGTVSFQVDVSGAAGNQQIQYTVTVLPQNDEQPEQDPQNPADLPAEKTENQEPDQSETITVTFRIDNPDYTQDAGSRNTHITVDAPYDQGQGLSYTQWGKTYKVTGTGVLKSYEIPAGTALASWPKVNVTNIGDDNEVTYISSYAWVDGQGNVCSPNAAFAQDTVLSLYLYQDNTSYSLNFVCGGCDGAYHSIPYVLGGYPSATFRLGQSVSQEYIPTAEAINANYSSEWCQHGKDHGETFDKWQLKNTATGEMVDFAAGVPITQDYVENGDHSIKVYAQWLKEPVTATFKNGETVVEERKVNKGSALGTLPAVTAPEGQVFQGWEYTDGEGNLQPATEETILTQNTVFTAKFVQSQICSVTFRDVPPQGDEVAAVTVQVDSGRTLEQAIQASDQSAWADGTPLSQCKWYTLGQDGQKVPTELSDVVSGNMELYTYTYEVVLRLSPEQAAMALSMVEVQDHPDGSITPTITAREDQQLAASDFVIDGVDYSVYTWQTQDGATVSIQNLIRNGLTENITATSTETANETGNIQFFIAIDGEWTRLAERDMTLYTLNGRYALTAAQLESVYGAYGFRAGNLKGGSRMFPHTSRGDATIWADAAAKEENDIVYAQLLQKKDVSTGSKMECDVYYLPKNSMAHTDSIAKDNLAAAESFYSVKIQDPGHKVYPEGQLPAAAYTLNGGTATVTVKTVEDVTWQCVGKNGGTAEWENNGDGTVTFTIQNINQPYVISPQLAEGEVQVTYNINLPQPPADETYGKPNIQGGEVYTHVAKAENYTLLAPSMTSYFYESGKYLGEATFLGWAIDGSSEPLYQPGGHYTIPTGTTQVTFTAQWKENLGGTSNIANSTMVNFFVALTAIPEGGSSWVGSTETNFFTDSVFTTDCGVTGNDAVTQKLYFSHPNNDQYFILGATSGQNLNAIHSVIVNNLTDGYTKVGQSGEKYTFRAEFPTDEVIMRQIRSMVGSGTTITLNGKTVPAEDLTAENFTVKWHVFKYDDSDGWHIDGVLVAKTGKLRITKTFAGDAEAIEALKNGYQIQYESVPFQGEGDLNPPHPGGTLTLTGDTVYNPATNTYTWEVDVDQYRDYQIMEEHYTPSEPQITLTAQYQVQHSKFAGQNTTGWQPYQGSVTVTGQSQTDTALQTVSFLNTYTRVGTMTLRKVDALTNGLMANVSFTVAKQGDPGFQLYSLGNGQYTADQSEQGAELAPGNQVTTNANGLVFLDLGGTGTYTFTEEVPTGYEDPGVITVTLGNGSIISASAENTAGNRQFTEFSGSELLVRNYSKVVPLVVEKIWADNENTSVTLQGLVGGQSMGSDYSVDLSNQNWTHTFSQKVPLYINGQKAVYSLLEENIGTWSYSPEYADDGYRYYDVSYAPMVYRNSQGQVVTNPDQAEEIYLSVTNQRSTGALTIRKVDQDGVSLPGAEFYLYKASEDPGEPPVPTQDNVLVGVSLVKSATSTDTGQVNFGNVPVGRYYLIEHAAPEFYQGTNTVYLVEVQEGSSTMKQWVNDAWAATTKTVTNTLQTMEVTIKKVVAGNFGDHTKDFAFTVTSDKAFSADTGYVLSNSNKTASFDLKHNGSVTLRVQAGATLTIAETNAQDYTMRLAADKGKVTENRYTVSENDATITVTNTKDTEVDTGITLDSLPYILLLVLAVLGGIFFLAKHKRRRED